MWVVLLIGLSKFSTDQTHYPDLGDVASSVWNFCAACFSDAVLQETNGDVAKCRLVSEAAVSATLSSQSHY